MPTLTEVLNSQELYRVLASFAGNGEMVRTLMSASVRTHPGAATELADITYTFTQMRDHLFRLLQEEAALGALVELITEMERRA